MAVDTRNKRESCLGIGMGASRYVRPNPDGTIAAADRAHNSWNYPGIAAQAIVVPDEVIYYASLSVSPTDYCASC